MTRAKNIPRDGSCSSAWQQKLPPISPSNYGQNAEFIYDCIIIGAGITGLTAALLLQKQGLQTVIAEAHCVGYGTTGGTSAHVNTFADTSYKEAESAFGAQGAQLFANAIQEGFALIRSNADEFEIDCDYEIKDGYIYAENEDQVEQLKAIYEGSLKVGVSVNYVEHVQTPVSYLKALKFDKQAQFHPLKYLIGLQNAYLAAGGIVLENTRIEKISSKDEVQIAESISLNIRAKKVIYATHMPPNINVFNFRCAPYRSYVIAVELKSGNYPYAMIYDMQQPYHYLRSHLIDGQQVLIAGGNDHKTAQEDPELAFKNLEEYIRKYYDVSSIKYKWSSQYYVPVDGFPYIGQMPFSADGIFCATGYNGNGMMLGSISGKILSDLVSGKQTKYEALFNPSRLKPVDGFTEFVKENANVAYHLVADRLAIKEAESLKQIRSGTGNVIEVDGKKIAAYRDEKGELHALSPICTHAACIVKWNSEEKSWDCPCHGARYDIDGAVLTGPATHPLTKMKLTDHN